MIEISFHQYQSKLKLTTITGLGVSPLQKPVFSKLCRVKVVDGISSSSWQALFEPLTKAGDSSLTRQVLI